MLYVSLVVSALLLVAVNLVVLRSRHPVGFTIGWCVAAVIVPVGIMLVLPTVALQALLLCLALVLLALPRRGKLAYVAASVLVTATAYGITVVPEWRKHQEQQAEYARLRDRFPFESIEGRLPVRDAVPRGEQAGDAGRWGQLEMRMETGRSPHWLQSLHENSMNQFVNSPGFGVARMVRFNLTEETLTDGLRDDTPVPQPGSPVGPGWEADDRKGPLDLKALGFERMHDEGVIDFLHPKGFGYVKDRRRVAGFQSHRFSKVPSSAGEWKVGRLELVGLVVHEKPMVYVSDNLPRMDELQGAPTREPDAFEKAGLAALRQGEDFYVRQGTDDVRLLGSVRSVKQCVACHGGARGDLLGAFSYVLRREK